MGEDSRGDAPRLIRLLAPIAVGSLRRRRHLAGALPLATAGGGDSPATHKTTQTHLTVGPERTQTGRIYRGGFAGIGES